MHENLEARLPQWLATLAPEVEVLGSPGLLVDRPIGLVGSRQCPGAILLAAADWADAWANGREQRPVIAGGFQTPVEAEVLRRMLRGRGRILRLPARSLPRRLPPTERIAFAEGRIAYASRFAAKRASAALAARRNVLLLDLARAAIVLHASPGSQTFAWATEAAGRGLPLFTLDHIANGPLLDLGAHPVSRLG